MDDWPTTPRIKANCPDCDDVMLSTSDVRVILHTASDEVNYAFQCPGCRVAVSQPADPRVILMLVTSGVRVTLCDVPAEVAERQEGSPLSLDDMIDLHFEIQVEGWLDRLQSTPSRRSQPG